MQEKKIEIFIITITILTTIMSVVGLTFAYFTTQISGTSSANVTVTSAKIGSLSLSVGENLTKNLNYDDGVSRTFTLTAGPSDLEQHVLVKMDYTNSLKTLNYEVLLNSVTVGGSVVSENITDVIGGSLNSGSFDVVDQSTSEVLASIDIKPNSETVVATYTLNLILEDTYEVGQAYSLVTDQFNGTLYGSLDDARKYYYYSGSRNGSALPS